MSATPPRRTFEAEYPADPRTVHEVRQRFEEFVRPHGLDGEELKEVTVAVSEAFTNAVCHGSPLGPANRVRFRCEVDAEQRLIVEVTDEGRGFQPAQIELPDFDEWKPSGRGLFLIVALMDDVQFEVTCSGTRVRLIKQLRAAGAPSASNGHSGRAAPMPAPDLRRSKIAARDWR